MRFSLLSFATVVVASLAIILPTTAAPVAVPELATDLETVASLEKRNFVTAENYLYDGQAKVLTIGEAITQLFNAGATGGNILLFQTKLLPNLRELIQTVTNTQENVKGAMAGTPRNNCKDAAAALRAFDAFASAVEAVTDAGKPLVGLIPIVGQLNQQANIIARAVRQDKSFPFVMPKLQSVHSARM